ATRRAGGEARCAVGQNPVDGHHPKAAVRMRPPSRSPGVTSLPEPLGRRLGALPSQAGGPPPRRAGGQTPRGVPWRAGGQPIEWAHSLLGERRRRYSAPRASARRRNLVSALPFRVLPGLYL